MAFGLGGQQSLDSYGGGRQSRGRRHIRFSFMNIIEDPFALSTISIAVVCTELGFVDISGLWLCLWQKLP
jgi:hypothetical protein